MSSTTTTTGIKMEKMGGKGKKGSSSKSKLGASTGDGGVDAVPPPSDPMLPGPDPTLTTPPPLYFSEEIPSKDAQGCFRKLVPSETFVDGIKNLDPELLTSMKGQHGFFSRHVVLAGEIGLGTKYGKTKFFPPGNYFWTRVGGRWMGVRKLQQNVSGRDAIIVHQDVSLLSLTENFAAVVQVGKNQYVVGSGRYIIRQPARLESDPVNIQSLTDKHEMKVLTEGGKVVKKPDGTEIVVDELTEKTLTAGYTARAGAITFVRPEPGFQFVIQNPSGFRAGTSFTLARGEENFLRFMNVLQQSRTTRRFEFLSKDFHKVHVRVQLTWQLVDPIGWLKLGGAYDDPFDFLEEKCESLFRDKICALGHEEALAQKADGFEDMEVSILPKLEKAINRLGAQLFGMEVRELRFPLIEQREVHLASTEAKTREQLLTNRRELELQKLRDEKQADLELAQQRRDVQQARATAEKLKIQDERALAEVNAKADQAKAEVDGEAMAEMARLEAEKLQASVQAETAKKVAFGAAEARLEQARGEAEALLTVERAKNKAMIERAAAQADAAKLMAEALDGNPALLELKKAELAAGVETERARALSAFAENPEALLPDSLTRDLLRMRGGERPQEFIPILGAVGNNQ